MDQQIPYRYCSIIFLFFSLQDLGQFPGWCTPEKAQHLIDFMVETKPKLVVEIGTFGGSTTYPLASALRFNQEGTIYTIDAWDNGAAVEGFESSSGNIDWWRHVDLEKIHQKFLELIHQM